MTESDGSPATQQGSDRQEYRTQNRPTGSGLVDARAESRARGLYSAHVDHQVVSALQTAHMGVVYKPFADSPGAIEASPARFWDYFTAELSKTRSLSTFVASERRQSRGQTDLETFTGGEKA